jgi:hypothetical protein
LPFIVLLDGKGGGEQILKGLLVENEFGSGRRHSFRRGGTRLANRYCSASLALADEEKERPDVNRATSQALSNFRWPAQSTPQSK